MNKNRQLLAFAVLGAAILGCNLPRSAPAQPQVSSSGLPAVTLQPGSGYLFATQQIALGPNDRDVWWNGSNLVPDGGLASLGQLNNLASVQQISRARLKSDFLIPMPGEAFVVEVTPGTDYALMRVLSIGSQAEISFEWVYPFAGQVLP